MEMDRRAALAMLGAGVAAGRLEAAQQHLHALAAKPEQYKLQFFSPAEHDLIDAVAELIIPADTHSPGAHDAKVAAYIDLVVSYSPADVKNKWRSRLAAFRDLAQRHGTLTALEQAATNERSPSTPAEHFFVDVKRLTVSGYYTTEIGLLKELGYKGNEVLGRFQGCQHKPGTHK
jgi:hypothetical protein